MSDEQKRDERGLALLKRLGEATTEWFRADEELNNAQRHYQNCREWYRDAADELEKYLAGEAS